MLSTVEPSPQLPPGALDPHMPYLHPGFLRQCSTPPFIPYYTPWTNTICFRQGLTGKGGHCKHYLLLSGSMRSQLASPLTGMPVFFYPCGPPAYPSSAGISDQVYDSYPIGTLGCVEEQPYSSVVQSQARLPVVWRAESVGDTTPVHRGWPEINT